MNTRLRLWSATLAGLLGSGAATQDAPHAFVGATIETCAGATIQDGALVVRTTAPEWAARLRFETERLLALSREVYPGTTSVKVRVAYPDE